MSYIKPDHIPYIVWDQLDTVGKTALLSTINNDKYLKHKICLDDNKYMITDKDVWKKKLYYTYGDSNLLDKILEYIWEFDENNKFNKWNLEDLLITKNRLCINPKWFDDSIKYNYYKNEKFNFQDFLNGWNDYAHGFTKIKNYNNSYDLGYFESSLNSMKNYNTTPFKSLDNLSSSAEPISSYYNNNLDINIKKKDKKWKLLSDI